MLPDVSWDCWVDMVMSQDDWLPKIRWFHSHLDRISKSLGTSILNRTHSTNGKITTVRIKSRAGKLEPGCQQHQQSNYFWRLIRGIFGEETIVGPPVKNSKIN